MCNLTAIFQCQTTTKGEKALADSSYEKMISNREIHNKPSKAHKLGKDDATKISPSRKSHKGTKQFAPKQLTPCPFLERRGFCKKCPLCGFLHNQPRPSKVTQCPPQNPLIIVTEIWLSVDIPDNIINILCFILARKDRHNGFGGGCVICISDEIPMKIRNDFSDTNIECQWLILRPKWLPRSVLRLALNHYKKE